MGYPFRHRKRHRSPLRDCDKAFTNYATILARILSVCYGDSGTIDYVAACPARPKDSRLLGSRFSHIIVKCIEPLLVEEYNRLEKGDHIRVKVFHCANATSPALGRYIRGDYIGRRLENLVEEPDATSGN